MKDLRKIVARAVVLAALSGAVGLAINSPLLIRCARGEFRRTFIEVKVAPEVTLISLPETEDLFASGQAVFLDTRSPEEYAAGHIYGAKNVPVYDAGVDLIWESLAVPQEALLVVYCSGGFCQDSLTLAQRLYSQGWRKVKVFSGGWVEWNAAQLPVERRQ